MEKMKKLLGASLLKRGKYRKNSHCEEAKGRRGNLLTQHPLLRDGWFGFCGSHGDLASPAIGGLVGRRAAPSRSALWASGEARWVQPAWYWLGCFGIGFKLAALPRNDCYWAFF